MGTDVAVRVEATLRELGRMYPRLFARVAPFVRLVPMPDIGTAGMTANLVLAYSPDWVDSLIDSELTGLVAHELLHWLLRHHERRGDRDARKWAYAVDAETNAIVTQVLDLTLPHYPSPVRMWEPCALASAEAFYERVPTAQVPQEVLECHGTGVGLDPKEWEQIAEALAPALSESELRELREETDMRAGTGSVEHVQRAAEDRQYYVPTRVVRALDRFLRDKRPGLDVTVTRPPKPHEIFARGGGARSFAAVLDVSGSMDVRRIRAACGVARLLASRYAIALDAVYACDTQVRAVYKHNVPPEITTGGGTELDVGIDTAFARGADLVIVISDMYSPWRDRSRAELSRIFGVALDLDVDTPFAQVTMGG